MKSWKILYTALAFCATQAFAIIGIGGHYTPNFGTELKASSEKDVFTLKDDAGNQLTRVGYKHGKFSGMQGFGFKLWIDFLPIIDIEATYNIQFGSYSATLTTYGPTDELIKSQKIELEFDGVPFGKAEPKFVSMNGDLSITYPITWLPIIRPYIGGGITYFINTPVLSDKFVSKFMNATGKILLEESEMTPEQAKQLAKDLQDALEDESLNTGIGGHLLVGIRAKLPIIPVAAYANYKFYFGGDFDSEIDFGRHAIEIGAGFAL